MCQLASILMVWYYIFIYNARINILHTVIGILNIIMKYVQTLWYTIWNLLNAYLIRSLHLICTRIVAIPDVHTVLTTIAFKSVHALCTPSLDIVTLPTHKSVTKITLFIPFPCKSCNTDSKNYVTHRKTINSMVN